MLGLVKKDFYIIKSNFKIFALILIFYIFLALQDSFDISILPPFISIYLMISTFSYDDVNNFNAYAITFPNGRRNVVLEKYLITIAFTYLITFLVMALEFIIAYSRGVDINALEVLIKTLAILDGTSLVEAVMYPIIFKFGTEKARIAIFVFVFGFFILLGLLSTFLDLSFVGNLFNFLENTWYIVLPAFAILILGISYFLSKHFYFKKEF